MPTVSRRRFPNALAALALAALALAPARAADRDRNADALFETASASFKLGRYEDAGKKFYDFMAAAPDDPRNDEAQYYAARCQQHRNYLNKAIEEYTFLITDFPDSRWTTLGLHDRAACYLATRRLDEAVKDMEAVTKRPVQIYHDDKDAMLRQLYENHRSDVFWLADHYLKSNQPEAAIAVYRRLPYEMEAFRNVVNVYYGLKQFDKIRDLIDALQEKNRHEGFKYLIEFYGKSKAYNQLKEIFARLLEEKNATRQTDELVWTTATGFGNFGEKQWDWAMRQVSTHYPRMARQADFELARRYWQDINYSDDLELFALKYRSGSDVDEVLRWKGITLERNGRADEARKAYRRMGDAGQGHWYAAESFHGQFAKDKDLRAAVAEYEAVRKAFYSQEWSAMAQWRVGELLRALKDVDGAADAWRQLVNRFGAVAIKERPWRDVLQRNLGCTEIEFGPEAQLALGDTLMDAKRYEDAVLEYRALVTKFPKTRQAAAGAYRTALCYEALADPDTAVKVLKSVLRRFPKTPAASDAHTRLETKYKIDDTEVTDDLDFFTEKEISTDQKNYIEDTTKMKRDR